jgi:hypothetical protein
MDMKKNWTFALIPKMQTYIFDSSAQIRLFYTHSNPLEDFLVIFFTLSNPNTHFCKGRLENNEKTPFVQYFDLLTN